MNTLDLALQIEAEGERYYTRQAEIHEKSPLKYVFEMLAKDEREHAALLRQYAAKKQLALKENVTFMECKKIFYQMEKFKNEADFLPAQSHAYAFALQKEKDSIDLYTGMLQNDTPPDEKELIGYLLHQEREHYGLIETLLEMTERSTQWVEAAEFGNRPEY